MKRQKFDVEKSTRSFHRRLAKTEKKGVMRGNDHANFLLVFAFLLKKIKEKEGV